MATKAELELRIVDLEEENKTLSQRAKLSSERESEARRWGSEAVGELKKEAKELRAEIARLSGYQGQAEVARWALAKFLPAGEEI